MQSIKQDKIISTLFKPGRQVISIQGGPGTGKTTLIQTLYESLDKQLGIMLNIKVLIQPLGALNLGLELLKPTLPLQKVIIHAPKTAYSFFKLYLTEDDYGVLQLASSDYYPITDAGNVFRLVIIDEAYQLPHKVIRRLIEWWDKIDKQSNTKLIILGDRYQLVNRGIPSLLDNLSDYYLYLNKIYRNTAPFYDYYTKRLVACMKQDYPAEKIPFKEFKPDFTIIKDDTLFQEEAFKAIQSNNRYVLLCYHVARRSELTTAYKHYTTQHQTNKKLLLAKKDVITLKGQKKECIDVINTIKKKTHHITYDNGQKSISFDYYLINLVHKVPINIKDFKKAYKILKRNNKVIECRYLNRNFSFLNENQIRTIHSCQGREYDKVFIDIRDILSGFTGGNQQKLRLLNTAISRSTQSVTVLI